MVDSDDDFFGMATALPQAAAAATSREIGWPVTVDNSLVIFQNFDVFRGLYVLAFLTMCLAMFFGGMFFEKGRRRARRTLHTTALTRITTSRTPPADTDFGIATRTRSIGVQSQARYSWKSTTPRFVPLPETAHGVWLEG